MNIASPARATVPLSRSRSISFFTVSTPTAVRKRVVSKVETIGTTAKKLMVGRRVFPSPLP